MALQIASPRFAVTWRCKSIASLCYRMELPVAIATPQHCLVFTLMDALTSAQNKNKQEQPTTSWQQNDHQEQSTNLRQQNDLSYQRNNNQQQEEDVVLVLSFMKFCFLVVVLCPNTFCFSEVPIKRSNLCVPCAARWSNQNLVIQLEGGNIRTVIQYWYCTYR